MFLLTIVKNLHSGSSLSGTMKFRRGDQFLVIQFLLILHFDSNRILFGSVWLLIIVIVIIIFIIVVNIVNMVIIEGVFFNSFLPKSSSFPPDMMPGSRNSFSQCQTQLRF